MQRGYVFRLIPTHKQEQYFWNASGAARFIYNWALETKQKACKEQNLSLSGYNLCNLLTQLKKDPDYAWLNEIHNKVLKKSVLDCSDAFDRMFKGQRLKCIPQSTKLRIKFITDTEQSTEVYNKHVLAPMRGIKVSGLSITT